MIAQTSYSLRVTALQKAAVPLVRESTNLTRRFVLSRTNNCAVAP
ncbi:hypothetical protein J2X73_004668 [Novosphingobium sp. 1748]|nr:hypothetical protein [Novosphingobium sp. 1748]